MPSKKVCAAKGKAKEAGKFRCRRCGACADKKKRLCKPEKKQD